jgi:UDP-N-acetylglucosamine/UDP-N-acetylgalactosamine diphosphorylase
VDDTGIEQRLEELEKQGVTIVDPRQTWVDPEVELLRIRPGAVLGPGTRLQGRRCFVGEGARVGTEGPATLVDAVLAAGASVASGFASGAVLLEGASLGANAHARGGTLLEEEASTAHGVGLKQTLLLSFVTLGSLINFCDCLMAGGTSRKDHSEVGSGYIHFNYTPWGERGDKATPSLVGDVPRGVFLREQRIFLGGTGGLVGPATVGFGAIAAAGQVWRGDLGENQLRLEPPRRIERKIRPQRTDAVRPRADKNVAYIGQLVALEAWYRAVRLERATEAQRPVVEAALENIASCIQERRKQLDRFLEERGVAALDLEVRELPPCPLEPGSGPENHIDWVRSLDDEAVVAGTEWLQHVVERVVERGLDQLPA